MAGLKRYIRILPAVADAHNPGPSLDFVTKHLLAPCPLTSHDAGVNRATTEMSDGENAAAMIDTARGAARSDQLDRPVQHQGEERIALSRALVTSMAASCRPIRASRSSGVDASRHW